MVRFLRRSLELTADEIRAIEAGWVIRTPSLPHVWNLNQLRIAKAVSPATVAELLQAHLEGGGRISTW